jgi:hypothetical protein
MKKRISYVILLWSAFLILITIDWKNIKYLFNLIKELSKLMKKNSKYIEDDGFGLIHKNKLKNL